MPTVEAVYLSGIPILLEDCETVGDAMTKIAMSHRRVATHIVIIDPSSGKGMSFDERIQIPKVEFVILNEETVEMDIESCKLNLRLHASQSDDVACSNLLDALRILDPLRIEKNAGGALRDAILPKKSKWADAARTLLRIGVNGDVALLESVEVGRADVVQFLVAGEVKDSELGWAPDLAAAFLKACATKHTQVVKVLLDAGADVNSKMDYGRTALMEAANIGKDETVRMLLDAGADVNSKMDYGRTALMAAANRGNDETVRMLLDTGADANNKEGDGETALMQAAIKGNKEIIRMLLGAGADVNSKTKFGKTALIVATEMCNDETVQILLDAGADVNSKMEIGWTALMIAAGEGEGEIARMLLDAGADVNSKKGNGRTALMEAVTMDKDETVRMLLDAGADANCESEDGTALSIAYARYNAVAVEILEEAGAVERGLKGNV